MEEYERRSWACLDTVAIPRPERKFIRKMAKQYVLVLSLLHSLAVSANDCYSNTLGTNEDHYIFRPESVFLDFPNELANISYSEAVVGATTSNTIIITQQNSIEEVANAAGSQSDSFSVLNNVALKTVNALRNARDGNKKEELRNWRIGVGVGVGVGVPLLMGLAFFAGKRQGRSKSIRSGSSY